jgi:uncharacterized protein YndB with AHSA1/START domain
MTHTDERLESDARAHVERRMKATPARVWEVLSDGWLYPLWVVGTSRMREVDADWPAVGAKLHHSVGLWPLLIDDVTEVLESNPEHLLRLRAHGWPMGAAEVRITLTPAGEETVVAIREDAVAGPAALVPRIVRQVPVLSRNREAMRRLAFLVERR